MPAFGSHYWISKGSCSLLAAPSTTTVAPIPSRGSRRRAKPALQATRRASVETDAAKGVKLCVKHATRPPSAASSRSEERIFKRTVCVWWNNPPKGSVPAYLSQQPNCQKASDLPAGGRRRPLETATPPARRGEGPNRGIEAADPEGPTTR